jgi:biotin synthase
MCYAIPGKLVQINGNIGVVDYFGEHRNVLMDSDACIGDYVYAQGGVLISSVPKDEAEKTLSFWKERFFELKKVDAKLAEVGKPNASNSVLGILQKANLGKQLNRDDMLTLLKLTDKDELKLLYETANNIRQREHDNACCVHGIIEFSNYCSNDCMYCGIRKSSGLQRYRLSVDEVIDVARDAVGTYGFKALVLQSGEDKWYDEEKLARIVKEIRQMGVLIFLSVGVRPESTYRKLYDAGARAILLRFETANREMFSKLRPDTSFDERVGLVKALKSMGYVIATGFMIGLPGETISDIADNILLTKSLSPDMYSFGPFIPVDSTPLEKSLLVGKEAVLKTIAISRLADRESKILVTTALETIAPEAKREGLMAGANSLMINITPMHYRRMYAIYPNRADRDKEIGKHIKDTTDLLYSLGRAPTDLGI